MIVALLKRGQSQEPAGSEVMMFDIIALSYFRIADGRPGPWGGHISVLRSLWNLSLRILSSIIVPCVLGRTPLHHVNVSLVLSVRIMTDPVEIRRAIVQNAADQL